MLVLSSPSGAGKSTIARNLLESDPSLELSVSVTTRAAPRQRDRWRALSFLYACASSSGCATPTRCSNGPRCTAISTRTPREPAEAAMAEGRDMLFDIDWQGAQQLKEKMRADIVSIFILPPSMTELKIAPEAPRRGSGSGHRDPAAERPHRDRALARIRLRRRQRRSRPRLRRSAGDRHGRAAAPRPPARPVRLRLGIARREDVSAASFSRGRRCRASRLRGVQIAASDAILDSKPRSSRTLSAPSHSPARRIPRRQRLGAPRRVDADACRAALRRRALSGSAAASCGAGRRPPR